MAPVFAIRRRSRGRPELKEMDLVDVHEAFAAQVASNSRRCSKKFAEERLGLSERSARSTPTSSTSYGGSIAIGHPFARPARDRHLDARELNKTREQHALITVCAAGGLRAAIVWRSRAMSVSITSPTEKRRAAFDQGPHPRGRPDASRSSPTTSPRGVNTLKQSFAQEFDEVFGRWRATRRSRRRS